MEINISETFEKVRIEEGLYPAVLRNVKDNGMKTFPAKDGKPENTAQQIILEFDVITKKDHKDMIVSIPFFGYAPATKNNKLGQALEALGADLTTKNKKVDIDKFILGKCRVMVEDYTKNGEKSSCITKVKKQE